MSLNDVNGIVSQGGSPHDFDATIRLTPNKKQVIDAVKIKNLQIDRYDAAFTSATSF
jgi:hypothetical protein